MPHHNSHPLVPWTFSWLDCVICGHAQVSVYPIIAPRLECAACGYLNPLPEPPDQAPRWTTDGATDA